MIPTPLHTSQQPSAEPVHPRADELTRFAAEIGLELEFEYWPGTGELITAALNAFTPSTQTHTQTAAPTSTEKVAA